MVDPPRRSREALQAGRLRAVEIFRAERLGEPLEIYVERLDHYCGVVRRLLTETQDLVEVREQILQILGNPELLRVFRYLAAPPISEDDLRTLADVESLAATRRREDVGEVRRVADVVLTSLDERRFPWVREGRAPLYAEREAAVLASAAIMAVRAAEGQRRRRGSVDQETRVAAALARAGLRQTPARPIAMLADAPGRGEFCRESTVGRARADFVIGLLDGRTMAIECKASNSAINSVKRLNREAASKSQQWVTDFGAAQVVPAVVLAGVYKLHNLEDAQRRGLAIFWEHDLEELVSWIRSTSDR